MALTKVSRELLNTSIVDNGNATAITIDSSENVGIGTSSPSSFAGDCTLALNDSGGARLGLNGSSRFFYMGCDSGSDRLEIGRRISSNTTDSPDFVLNGSGQVGIGTSAPAGPLQVYGDDYVYISPNVANKTPNSTHAGIALGWNKSSGEGESIIAYNKGAGSPGGLVFSDYSGTYAERMRIDGSGKVGIGTSAPEYNLDVTAADNVTTTTALSVQNASRNYGLGLGAYTLTNRNIGGTATTVDYTFDIGRHAIFKTNNAERMRINSSGTLLVGKSSSATNLTGLEAHGSGAVFSSISSGNTYHVKNTTNNVFTFYVGYTGGVINYQSLNVNLSDEREKKNIEPLESKWDSVKSWSLKTFHYNHQADESIKNYGVIAQDVEQTNPEAIDVYQKDEDTERKGVKEQQMMWMAIKALQEAQTRIETLETRIAALEE
jgi:hypothetical protein